MTNRESKRGLVRASWALMLTPILLLLVFLTLVLHAWIGLGHLPKPMVEDYQTATFHLHRNAVIWFGCFTIWGALPLWLVLVCTERFRPTWSWKLPVVQALVYAVGWCVIAAYAAWDPGQFVNWYLD